MALWLVGLGLNPPHSITKEGLAALSKCGHLFIETYTNQFKLPLAELSKHLNKPIEELNREELEQSNKLVELSAAEDVVLLVLGDPLFATTHTELLLRAKRKGVTVKVIHNASIVDAVLNTGLQAYKFGRIVSLPHPSTEMYSSVYQYIEENKAMGLHTLVLLDVARDGIPAMTIKKAVRHLFEMEERLNRGVINKKDFWLGCSSLGSANEKIVYARSKQLSKIDFREPPYCLIVPGKLHFLEEEFLEEFYLFQK